MKTLFKYIFQILEALTGILSAMLVYNFFTFDMSKFVVRDECAATHIKGSEGFKQCQADAAASMLETAQTFNLTMALVLGFLLLLSPSGCSNYPFSTLKFGENE